MEWSYVNDIIKDGEGPSVDFKEHLFLVNPDDIAAHLVSFANRDGGKILVGVTNGGTIQGAKIDNDKDSLTVQNVANNNCSPPVEVTFDYASSLKGDVLLINIPRRNGMPHAIVHRNGAEIRSRTYYIRSGRRKSLVDDIMLRFMFQNTNDPHLASTTGLTIWYNRKEFVFSEIESTDYMFYMLPFLQEIRHKDRKYLSEHDSKHIPDLMIEVFPYAFLMDLSKTFTSSWLVDIEKTAGITTTRPLKVDLRSDIVSAADIPMNSMNVLTRLTIDIKDILSKSLLKFRLPEDTKIEIEIKVVNDFKQSILRLKNPFFTVNISFYTALWSVGLPPIIQDYLLLDQDSITNSFATCMFIMKFETQFSLPDIYDPLFEEHHLFAQTIQHIIYNRWNWDKELERLKDSRIDRINNNVMKIRSLLEKGGVK
jgi:hypothetical protein